jgi:hypothetical protein
MLRSTGGHDDDWRRVDDCPRQQSDILVEPVAKCGTWFDKALIGAV